MESSFWCESSFVHFLLQSIKDQRLGEPSCSTESKDQTPPGVSDSSRSNLREGFSAALSSRASRRSTWTLRSDRYRSLHLSELRLSAASGFSQPLNSHWAGSRRSWSKLQEEKLQTFSLPLDFVQPISNKATLLLGPRVWIQHKVFSSARDPSPYRTSTQLAYTPPPAHAT